MANHDSTGRRTETRPEAADGVTTSRYVVVSELRSEDDPGTCLRPLGLCDLGGCCDSCWYRPDHPRFRR